MRPQIHFLLGIIFVIFLYFFFFPIISVFGLTIIFLSSVLIDIDHYIYYVFKKKDLNPFKAYEWYKKYTCKFCSLPNEKQKKLFLGFYFLHGIEILLLFLFLGYISQFFIFIFIGFFFHWSVDLISDIIWKRRLDKLSIIYNILNFRKLTPLE